MAELEYLARRRHLDGTRTEMLASTTRPAMPIAITGIGEAWRKADPARMRLLLGAFFEKLYVEDGAVTKYVPRREYAGEVEALVGLAVGDGLEYDVLVTGRGQISGGSTGRPRH